jgi:hypothetical protein
MSPRGIGAAATLFAALVISGCSSHVLFVEHSHLGLKASFEPNQPTPAEVDLGWRRALFAMVPQSRAHAGSPPPLHRQRLPCRSEAAKARRPRSSSRTIPTS